MVKEQAVKIQQVSPQLEMSKPAPHWSGTNSKLRNGSSLVCHGTEAIWKARSHRGERLYLFGQSIAPTWLR